MLGYLCDTRLSDLLGGGGLDMVAVFAVEQWLPGHTAGWMLPPYIVDKATFQKRSE